jgi:hypothetical protein
VEIKINIKPNWVLIRGKYMTFSMKPSVTSLSNSGGGASTGDWSAWNEYYYGLFEAEELPAKNKEGDVIPNKVVKKVPKVGILNRIVDCGFQEQLDAEYESRLDKPAEGEEHSAEELAHLDKFKNNYFKFDKDGKRLQCRPQNPVQEYHFSYDFPDIVVDWAKHPIEDLHKLGCVPLRVSVNGYSNWGGRDDFRKHIKFDPNYKTKVISDKSVLAKIAAASVNKDGTSANFEGSGYDLGALATTACSWEIVVTKNTKDGKIYYNTDLGAHSKINPVSAGAINVSVEQQIPECPVPFVGLWFDVENAVYDPQAVDTIRHDKGLKAVLPRAANFKPSAIKFPDFILGCNWVDSSLCKALGGNFGSGSGSTAPASNVKEEEGAAAKNTTQPTKVEPDKDEPKVVESHDDDFSDEIPF